MAKKTAQPATISIAVNDSAERQESNGKSAPGIWSSPGALLLGARPTALQVVETSRVMRSTSTRHIHRLAVDGGRADPDCPQRLGDFRHSVRPVMTAPGEGPNPIRRGGR